MRCNADDTESLYVILHRVLVTMRHGITRSRMLRSKAVPGRANLHHPQAHLVHSADAIVVITACFVLRLICELCISMAVCCMNAACLASLCQSKRRACTM